MKGMKKMLYFKKRKKIKNLKRDILQKSFCQFCESMLADFLKETENIESQYKNKNLDFESACVKYFEKKAEYIKKYKQAIKFFDIKL